MGEIELRRQADRRSSFGASPERYGQAGAPPAAARVRKAPRLRYRILEPHDGQPKAPRTCDDLLFPRARHERSGLCAQDTEN